jgi:nucleoside-diphosphate-sugar epimerase
VNDVVLVTGAGGFVGSAVLRCLVARLAYGDILLPAGQRVRRVVGVLRPGQDAFRLDEVPRGNGWGLRQADLCRADAAEELVRSVRPVAIIHAALDPAVFTAASRADAERLVAKPLEGLIRGLAVREGSRFVHAGSAWVLPAGQALDEHTALAPRSPYGFAKALEDALVPELARGLAIEWSILRLFNLIGRYERPDRLIPYLVRQLTTGRTGELSHAQNIRDFTDVDVVATAFVRALEAPVATDALFHIGTGRGTSVGRVAQLVSERLGRPDLVRFGVRATPDDSMEIQVANVSLARTRLGWSAGVDTETWVREAVDWWVARQPAVAGGAEGQGMRS